MNYLELLELLKYIEDNHSWYSHFSGKFPDNKYIKYVNFDVDTRTSDIWRVTFREISAKTRGGEISFRTDNTDPPLKDRIYEWLKEE